MKRSKSLICTRWLMAFSAICLSLLYAFDLHPARPALAAEAEQESPGGLADGRFGINNVNRAWVVQGEVILSERRVQQALAVGSRWNRVNVWWYDVEPYNDGCPAYPDYPDEPLSFVWNDYENLISYTQGLNTLFILQGVPVCWRKWNNGNQDIQVPARLDEPIFEHPGGEVSDDITGAIGINRRNPWANYVYQVVTHLGARYLQVWNEPTTLTPFGDPYWRGSLDEFSRLVEITYFAAQYGSQDEHVHLVLPGQSDPEPGSSLHDDVKKLFRQLAEEKSPLTGEPYLNYFDVYATHDYNWPWRTVEYPRVMQDYLAQYSNVNLAPFWITEFGADEHFPYDPAPEGIEGPEELQRASVIVQSIVYLLAAGEEHGIERFFQFQLDNTNECGLLKGPVDFEKGQYGDQYERQAYTALLQVNTYLGDATPMSPALFDTTPEDHSDVDHQEVYFSSPAYDKITVLWSTTLNGPITATFVPLYPGRVAKLVWQDGVTETITPTQGVYPIELPAAVNSEVGGKTVLLLEDEDFPEVPTGDSDGDTIPDEVECPGMSDCPDTDGDGIPDFRDPDDDGDSVPTIIEAELCDPPGDDNCVCLGPDDAAPCYLDTDGDGIPDFRDPDDDGDGVLTSVEAELCGPPGGDNCVCLGPDDAAPCYLDTDGDGIPDFLDPDEVYVSPAPIEQCSVWKHFPWGFDRGVACGLQMIRDTLAKAGYDVNLEDPPVPGMLFDTAPFPALPPGSASARVAATATHTATSVAASLTTSHTVLSGDLQATWSTDAWAGAQFTSLSVDHAYLYDENDVLVAAGAVQASPLGETGGDFAFALALGDALTYSVAGQGSAAYYAPAVDGLGVGGRWLTYTAHVRSGAPYGVGLQGAAVTVDGQAYTGTLVLVTTGTVTLKGDGYTLAPNFADRVLIQAANTSVRISESASQRIAYSGYTGPMTITEYTAELDRVELNGPTVRDLSLELDPAASSITPVESASFQAHIHANQDDTYTLTVAPPTGWQAQVDASGRVTVTPALDAEPGVYPVRVAAQSASLPLAGGTEGGLFSTAIHEITILPWQGLDLSVVPDPLTTVPMGPISPPSQGGAGGGSINNGQAQVPDAAYVATITNTSSTGHTFIVQATPDGFPAAWIMLGGAGRAPTTTVTLPAGGVGNLGVYVSPVGLDVLPPAGTEYPFTVRATAVDDPALTRDAPETAAPADGAPTSVYAGWGRSSCRPSPSPGSRPAPPSSTPARA